MLADEGGAMISTKSLTKRYRVGGHDLLATNNVSVTINNVRRSPIRDMREE